jgi:hypothetical protein
MKPKRTFILVGAAIMSVFSCRKETETVVLPVPVAPRLSVEKPEYASGEKIGLQLTWPPSDWRLIEQQRNDIRTDGFWPYYVRIDGKDWKLRHGVAPFSALSSGFDLHDSLQGSVQWPSGEYHVAYVLKGLTIYHPENPEHAIHFDEWASNEIVVRVTGENQQTTIESEYVKPATWITVNVRGLFSFDVPPNTTEDPVQGIDSLVGRYRIGDIELGYDCGAYSSTLEEFSSDEGYVRRTVAVDGWPADLVATDAGNMGIAFPKVPSGAKLTLHARYTKRESKDTVEQILLSIKFPK